MEYHLSSFSNTVTVNLEVNHFWYAGLFRMCLLIALPNGKCGFFCSIDIFAPAMGFPWPSVAWSLTLLLRFCRLKSLRVVIINLFVKEMLNIFFTCVSFKFYSNFTSYHQSKKLRNI